MIKMIIVITISLIVSACTSIMLMMRYSKPVTFDFEISRETMPASEDDSVSDPVKDNDSGVHAWAKVKENITVVDSGSASQIRYFDYEKLNQDLGRISTVLERFNNLLTQEIQRVKRLKEQEGLNGSAGNP